MTTKRNNPFHEARIKRLMSVPALAEVSGVSVRTIYRAERGEGPIRDIAQEALAQALGFEDRRVLFPEPEEGAA